MLLLRLEVLIRMQKKYDEVTIQLKNKETGLVSEEVPLEEILYGEDVEFKFWEDDSDYSTLPYKDFLFYRSQYDIILKTGQKEEIGELKKNLLQAVNLLRGYGHEEAAEYLESKCDF